MITAINWVPNHKPRIEWVGLSKWKNLSGHPKLNRLTEKWRDRKRKSLGVSNFKERSKTTFIYSCVCIKRASAIRCHFLSPPKWRRVGSDDVKAAFGDLSTFLWCIKSKWLCIGMDDGDGVNFHNRDRDHWLW